MDGKLLGVLGGNIRGQGGFLTNLMGFLLKAGQRDQMSLRRWLGMRNLSRPRVARY